jgi:hypothetical protein
MIEQIGEEIAEVSIEMDDVNYYLDDSMDEATREVAYMRMESLKGTMKTLKDTAKKHRIYDEAIDAASQKDAMMDFITY